MTWIQQPSDLWVNIPFPTTLTSRDETLANNTPTRFFSIVSSVRVPYLDPNYKWAMVMDVVVQNHQPAVDNYRGFARTIFRQYINGVQWNSGFLGAYSGPNYVPSTDGLNPLFNPTAKPYTLHTSLDPITKEGDLTDYVRQIAAVKFVNDPSAELLPMSINPAGWVTYQPNIYAAAVLMAGDFRPLLRLEVDEEGSYGYAPLFPPPPTCSITQSTLWLIPFLSNTESITAAPSPMGLVRMGRR